MGRLKGDLLERTKRFAGTVLDLVNNLPDNRKGWETAGQLLRAGTSVGADLREANLAMSDADFIRSVAISRKEAGEAEFWLELIIDKGLISDPAAAQLLKQEAQELVSILGTMIVRTKEKHR